MNLVNTFSVYFLANRPYPGCYLGLKLANAFGVKIPRCSEKDETSIFRYPFDLRIHCQRARSNN